MNKIRIKMNEIETYLTPPQNPKFIQRTNETKCWFLEKINKTDKLLAKLYKKRRRKTQINKVRSKMGAITSVNKIQRIMRKFLENYIQIKLKIQKKWTKY
jgi:hypothetical protein